MKTITLVLALSTFCFCASQAQDLPNDLTAISQADAPPFATYYSIAYWPDYPPLPWNAWDSAADLYNSPTYGASYIWVDDRAKVAGRMLTESFDPPPVPGGDDSGGPDPDRRRSHRLITEPTFGFKSSTLPISLATLAHSRSPISS